MLCGPGAAGVRCGSACKKRIGRSNAEGDRATFQLIANRLLRQFQEHNLQHANELFVGFGQWLDFASRAAGRDLTPLEAALDRCQRVAAGVERVCKLSPPDLPYLGAWYVDTHVPLVQSANAGKCRTVYDVYRQSLAPEQQGGFPIAVGPPFKPHDALKPALKAAWFPNEEPKVSLLSKLLQKGTRPPMSIRYIGPQCIRALDESEAGRAAMTSMVVAGALKAYPHSRVNSIQWDVEERATIYAGATVEGIRQKINSCNARQLFAAVCEYIVALTSQHPSLWRAVSCAPGGLDHIRRVQHDASYRPKPRSGRAKLRPPMLAAAAAAAASNPKPKPKPKQKQKKTAARSKIPSDITLRSRPDRLRAALLATTIEDTMVAEPVLSRKEATDLRIFVSRHQAPMMFSKLPEEAAAAQRHAVLKATGRPQLLVSVCRACTVIHRKIKSAPLPIKKRSGISVCIPVADKDDEYGGSDLKSTAAEDGYGRLMISTTRGHCAACGTEAAGAMVDAVGLEIRARVRHSDPDVLAIMVCGSCGALASDTVDMLGAPRCRQCAAGLRDTPWSPEVTRSCICGAPAVASPAVLVKVLPSRAGGHESKLLPVCPKHAAVAKHIPPCTVVPAKWLRELFRTRVTRSKFKASWHKRRLKQFTSARRFSFASGRRHSKNAQ